MSLPCRCVFGNLHVLMLSNFTSVVLLYHVSCVRSNYSPFHTMWFSAEIQLGIDLGPTKDSDWPQAHPVMLPFTDHKPPLTPSHSLLLSFILVCQTLYFTGSFMFHQLFCFSKKNKKTTSFVLTIFYCCEFKDILHPQIIISDKF